MLEKLLIRSRATPSEPPRRRGATSLGPERDRFGVLKGVLAAVPWLQVGMGAARLGDVPAEEAGPDRESAQARPSSDQYMSALVRQILR